MNIEQFKKQVVTSIVNNLRDEFMQAITVKFDEVLNKDDSRISGSVEITFTYGNCINKHIVYVAWDASEGTGIESMDGNILDINPLSLITSMYYELALSNLADEFLI